MGDIVMTRGTLMKTRIGGLSVAAMELRLLSKSLYPLPSDYYGLADQERRYRQHYADLIASKETHDTFRAHTKAMASLCNFMADNGLTGAETPIPHPVPGGTAARSFITHHNALDVQMFLRIAPELYLRRLIVGGFERVYEISHSSRNEGVSSRHNPKLTMMEFCVAYTDYRQLMSFTERLIRQVAIDASGTTTPAYQGRELDLAGSFHRLTICQVIRKYAS